MELRKVEVGLFNIVQRYDRIPEIWRQEAVLPRRKENKNQENREYSDQNDKAMLKDSARHTDRGIFHLQGVEVYESYLERVPPKGHEVRLNVSKHPLPDICR